MAEYLSGGVFIEEVPSQVQVVTAVTTSTVVAAGFTPRGTENDTILVGSPGEFTNKCGDLNSNTFLGLCMFAFFSNGGTRAYIIPVRPEDATTADCKIQSQTTDQEIETGDGVTAAFTKDSSTTQLKVNSGATPIVTTSCAIGWRGQESSALTTTATMARDGTTPLVTVAGRIAYEGIIDPTTVPTFSEKHHRVVPGTVTINFDGHAIAVAGTTDVATATTADGTVTIDHRSGRFSLLSADAIGTPGAVTADYTPTSGDQGDRAVATINTGGGADDKVYMIVDNVGAAGNAWTFEVVVGTGVLTAAFKPNTSNQILITLPPAGDTALNIAAAVTLLTGVTASMSGLGTGTISVAEGPTSFTGGRDANTEGVFEITDTVGVYPAGTLNTGVGLTGPGTIDYTTGAYSFTTAAGLTINTGVATTGFVTKGYTAVPHVQAPVNIDYQIEAWDLNPTWRGETGNDLRVQLRGNADYFTAATGQYSRFDINILLDTPLDRGTFVLKETWEELDLSTPTSAKFFPDVVNELSDWITVTEPGGDEPPGQLQAISRTNIIAGGDEQASGLTFATTLTNYPIQPRTVTITFTDDAGQTRTLTDDGVGGWTGDVDGAGVNTISYSLGTIDVLGSISSGAANGIQAGSLVTVTYYSAPAETTHTEDFGDTDKGYTAGADGTFDDTNYGRNQFTNPLLISSEEGIYASNKLEDVMQVILPDFCGDETITGDLLDLAVSRANQPSGADRFIILSVPIASDAQEAVDWFRFTLGRYSPYAALYWPWIKVADPLADGRPLTIPPIGHVAGVYARTDTRRNVGKAPAGTVDGSLSFLTALEMKPTQTDRDLVYQNRINPLIDTTPTGKAVWGARTMYSPSQTEWRYIQARRLFMFLEKSIWNSTHWIVFENNGPALWTQIAAQLNGFLGGLFNEGYFAGTTTSEAFFVTVDSSNNTEESINQGRVIIDVGVAPNRPAEFVIFRFTQKSLG